MNIKASDQILIIMIAGDTDTFKSAFPHKYLRDSATGANLKLSFYPFKLFAINPRAGLSLQLEIAQPHFTIEKSCPLVISHLGTQTQ